MTDKILSVSEIKLAIQKINPPILTITAKGEVPTGGWSKGRLNPFVYITPPKDGIYEFDFVADRPADGDVVSQGITSITAEPFSWSDFPTELKGVKIYASENEVIEMLP